MRLAQPIFLRGLYKEKDIQAGFRKIIRMPEEMQGACLLEITARTFYRLYVDGDFISHGPARAAHGYSRVDVLDLTSVLTAGREHVLAIEIAGYNHPSVYITGEFSFLLAELIVNDSVVIYTDHSWEGFRLYHRRQQTEAFSHARCLGESYDMDHSYIDWRTAIREGFGGRMEIEELDEIPELQPRVVPLPDMRVIGYSRLISVHDLRDNPDLKVDAHPHFQEELAHFHLSDSLVDRPSVACMKESSLPFTGALSINEHKHITISPVQGKFTALEYDFSEMNSGFIGIDYTCKEAGTIDLVFTDLLMADGMFNPRRSGSNSVIRLNSQPGRYTFISFEPHAFRYLKLITRGQSCTFHKVFVVLYQFQQPMHKSFMCNDGELNRIYEAAERTLIMSTLDIFMDCPGRERAGWLCDSFWSGRAARLMLGDTSVEQAMLDDFLHSDRAPLMEGFFPVCYPSGFGNQNCFIPNWPLFLILELDEYVRRSGDTGMLAAYKPVIQKLFSHFAEYENSNGLLENLPGFVFVEWSAANLEEYKRPISVATNALYAQALKCAGELYGVKEWVGKADHLQSLMRCNAFTGIWFSDSLHYNAEQTLIPGALFSEANQYYCFWTGMSKRKDQPQLVQRLITECGPSPVQPFSNGELANAGVFIGYFLRFDLLAQWGEHSRLLQEMRVLFMHMIHNGPGTLWEHASSSDSVCHGFASHAGVSLVRDILGLHAPDELKRVVRLAPQPCDLKWCKGILPSIGGTISMEWHQTADRFELLAQIPDRYTVRLEIPQSFRHGTLVQINGKQQRNSLKKPVRVKGPIHLIIFINKKA